MSEHQSGNREYKDSFFRLLFDSESKSAELYNAIKGTDYKPEALKMNTLQNPFFYGVLRNDLSFCIDDRLIALYEHNSTINPNIAFRFLLYVADVYETLMDKEAMYKTTKMSIAAPKFYLIYNGKAKYPDTKVLKLSELYKVKGGKPSLDLSVTVYNANKGHNKAIMARSEMLRGYAEFVAKVRRYTDEKGLDLTAALKRTADDCARKGILREFLQKHGGDVVSMISREWNMEDAKAAWEKGAKEEVAANFLREGISKEIVIRSTGLSAEQVENIAREAKIGEPHK